MGPFSVVIRQAPHCPSQRHHPLNLQVTPLWYDPLWGEKNYNIYTLIDESIKLIGDEIRGS